MKTKLIITTFFAFLFIIGCSKSDSTPAVTNTSLIAHTWNVQQVDGSVNGLVITAYTKGGAASVNILDFSKFQLIMTTDGKYTETDQNGSKTTGTWAFTNGEQSFTLTDATTKSVDNWSILALTATTFNIKHNINGTSPSVFDTYVIQTVKGIGFDASTNSSVTIKLIP